MYLGGCYLVSDGLPGNSLCVLAANGICTEAAPGYFLNPLKANSKDSVISCSNTTGFTESDKTYRGVQHCDKCDGSALTGNASGDAKCTKCSSNKYLKSDGTGCVDAANQCNANTEFGKENQETGNKCLKCNDPTSGVADCAECTGIAEGKTKPACTKCSAGFLLAPEGGETSCPANCPEGYFGHTDSTQKKTCQSCSSENTGLNPAGAGVAGCVKCTYGSNKVTCEKCGQDKYLKIDGETTSCVDAQNCGEGFLMITSGDIKKCVKCGDTANGGIEHCAKCSLKASSAEEKLEIMCSECTDRRLSPLNNACLENCPAGSYAHDGNLCLPCHNTCAECDGNAEATSCRACYPGFVLSKGNSGAIGTCIPACTGKYAENCEENMCTALVGGSKYCSKCKTGFVPVDGICVSSTARAPTGCTPGDGVCTACTDSYFLQSGGCYQSTAFPGNKLCTTASQGKCTSCANGQQADGSSGSCPACDSTCETCTEANKPDKCSTCPPSRYLDSTANACKLCTESSNNIQGVANCLTCVPPSGNSGPVTCYVKADGTSGGDDGTGGSTNKSGLSAGAIAGIAVAVVIVVGGLVGFLCWWFICRGKA
ncbi:VSP [Giardia lamblia P15]|uniref:VSP n=1 Tax=Giardia intestinalis (strain P15) TaxID=658858 RepID=E1F8U6_GIAIA|nr:VSP [Giardia lamblia P15]